MGDTDGRNQDDSKDDNARNPGPSLLALLLAFLCGATLALQVAIAILAKRCA